MALWYVDNSLGVNGNGTSWATAWNSLANIVWASLAGGDTLYISGGNSSQTYSEKLTVGKSGGVGTPITITAGVDAGHTGTVIIDGTTATAFNSSDAIVSNAGFTNLIIQNLTVQNTNESCVRVTSVTSGAVTVQNLIVHTGTGIKTLTTSASTAIGSAVLTFTSVPASITGGNTITATDATHSAAIPTGSPAGTSPTTVSSVTATTVTLSTTVVSPGVSSGDTINFGANCRGFRVDNNTATVTIQNCTIDTPASTIGQTDGFFTTLNSGTVVIQNNTITINNNDASGHSDGIQSFNDTAITYRNNVINHPNGGVNNHGILVQDVNAGGTVLVYNNVVNMGFAAGTIQGWPEIAMFREFLTAGKTGIVKWYNNTILAGSTGYDTYQTAGALPAGDEFKNNIIYLTCPGATAYFLTQGNLTTPANTDYNLVYNGTGNLTLTNISGVAAGGCRSTTSFSSGLKYFEVLVGTTTNGSNTMVGVGNASINLATWLGADANSLGLELNNGQIWTNNANTTTIETGAQFDLLAYACDFGNKKIWIKNLTRGSGWNNAAIGSQDPANNIGGLSIAGITSPWFAAASVGNGTNNAVTFNFGATNFFGTLPTGYSAWGSATTLDPAHIGAAASLVMFPSYVNGTYESWATWQAAGYDAHGVNSDPLFDNLGIAPNGLSLRTGSPAIQAGVTVATVVTDIVGVSRPQGTAYDIGAYEKYLEPPFVIVG